jgi:hypothetical protein
VPPDWFNQYVWSSTPACSCQSHNNCCCDKHSKVVQSLCAYPFHSSATDLFRSAWTPTHISYNWANGRQASNPPGVPSLGIQPPSSLPGISNVIPEVWSPPALGNLSTNRPHNTKKHSAIGFTNVNPQQDDYFMQQGK